MTFIDSYKDRLLSDARHAKRNVDFAAENNSGSEEDVAAFYDLIMKYRKAEYAINEQTRIKFMLTKSGLDSV
ncbi:MULTISPECIES: hypothetical protein [Pseudomonas]|jgi:hypothetical protein|uniref:Uncharacterized protein n=1 Tax=Pseudomonas quebecensis TaxID=2995174 RepID=A0ABY6QEL8_9PSED|nr:MULTISPECIES: hypothetical protein [Pseudomonas]MCX4063529.1 hypothetical protein [Pseudomonas quebecensis]UZW17792.1 hypothetical protein OSC50_20755 [Pseudomonas quebecensis]UZW24794.1 hypothetical protein OSC48_04725 [Pseudomonas quebecensis]UZW29857.1 hypothetical protein OSC49_04725 [Pseudomonas quebecensis]